MWPCVRNGLVSNTQQGESKVTTVQDLFSLSTVPSLSLVLNLHVTLMLGAKHGPVRLTMAPPNMWPFSGANVRGKLVPLKSRMHTPGRIWKNEK